MHKSLISCTPSAEEVRQREAALSAFVSRLLGQEITAQCSAEKPLNNPGRIWLTYKKNGNVCSFSFSGEKIPLQYFFSDLVARQPFFASGGLIDYADAKRAPAAAELYVELYCGNELLGDACFDCLPDPPPELPVPEAAAEVRLPPGELEISLGDTGLSFRDVLYLRRGSVFTVLLEAPLRVELRLSGKLFAEAALHLAGERAEVKITRLFSLPEKAGNFFQKSPNT